jgi:hypothetical protein
MAAKKTKTKAKPTSSKVNKSEFIRSHSKLPPAEIVKLAKAKGIELSIAMVYTILSEYRRKQGATKATKVTPKTTKAVTTSVATPKQSQSTEQELERLVMRIGTDRAQEVFQRVLARVLG